MGGKITGVHTGIATRPSFGRTIGSVIPSSTSPVALGMATIVASRGVVRGKAADATSKTLIGPVATKLASQPRSGKVRTTMDVGYTPITLCGIARILQRKQRLRPSRHHRFTRRLPSFGRPMSTTQPLLMAVAKRMALTVVTQDAVRGRAADVT